MIDSEMLRSLLEQFCSLDDTSIQAANAIEVALDEAFPNDDQVQDVVLALASYRPGGGELLYDEQEIKRRLAPIIRRLSEGL